VAAYAALASLALALAACGDSSAPAAEATVVKRDDVAVTRACPTELSRFTDSLQRLRRRLVAGLTYDEYVGAVRALRSEYAAIPVDAVAPACLVATGAPSERAFDVYVEAANRWGECLSEPGCDASTVEAPLQAEWHLAGRQLDSLPAGRVR
jgi:hypothetical protein